MNTATVGEPQTEPQDLSVLVAASTAFQRSLNAAILSRDFHVDDAAASGVEAKQLLDEHQPDVIVADRDLTIVDGLELARDANAASSDVGIVLLCAAASSVEAEADDHVDQVVTRPYQRHGLTEAVRRAARPE